MTGTVPYAESTEKYVVAASKILPSLDWETEEQIL